MQYITEYVPKFNDYFITNSYQILIEMELTWTFIKNNNVNIYIFTIFNTS